MRRRMIGLWLRKNFEDEIPTEIFGLIHFRSDMIPLLTNKKSHDKTMSRGTSTKSTIINTKNKDVMPILIFRSYFFHISFADIPSYESSRGKSVKLALLK